MGVRAAPARRAPISPSHAHLRKAQMICALVVRSGARAAGVRVCVVCGGGGGGVQRLLGSWLAFSFCARVLGCRGRNCIDQSTNDGIARVVNLI